MSGDVNVQAQGEPSVQASFGGEQTGFSTDRGMAHGLRPDRRARDLCIHRQPVRGIRLDRDRPETARRHPGADHRAARYRGRAARLAPHSRTGPGRHGVAELGARRFPGRIGAARRYANRPRRGYRDGRTLGPGRKGEPRGIRNPAEIVRVNNAVHGSARCSPECAVRTPGHIGPGTLPPSSPATGRVPVDGERGENELMTDPRACGSSG